MYVCNMAYNIYNICILYSVHCTQGLIPVEGIKHREENDCADEIYKRKVEVEDISLVTTR